MSFTYSIRTPIPSAILLAFFLSWLSAQRPSLSLFIGREALLLNGGEEVEEAIMRYEMVDLP